jgi:hypothetical protein
MDIIQAERKLDRLYLGDISYKKLAAEIQLLLTA